MNVTGSSSLGFSNIQGAMIKIQLIDVVTSATQTIAGPAVETPQILDTHRMLLICRSAASG
jgi:hypothetical protein